jgi:hypothetical protein
MVEWTDLEGVMRDAQLSDEERRLEDVQLQLRLVNYHLDRLFKLGIVIALQLAVIIIVLIW